MISTLKATSDPFRIRVADILDELADKIPGIDYEGLQLDGEILSVLSKVVKEQELWVKREASIASVGKMLALLKIKAMDERSLAKDLLDNWHPVVDLQQVTFTEVLLALSYLEGREEFKLSRAEAITLEPVSLELGIDLEKVIREVEEEVESLLKEGRDRISYRAFIGGKGRDEGILRAYAISYLATSGRIAILYDPLEDEYYITRSSGEGEAYSQIVELGRYLDAS